MFQESKMGGSEPEKSVQPLERETTRIRAKVEKIAGMPEDYRANAREILMSDSSGAEQRAWAQDVWRYEGYEWNDLQSEQSAAETAHILERQPRSRAQKEFLAGEEEIQKGIEEAILADKRKEIDAAEEMKRAQIQKELEAAQPPPERRWKPDAEPKEKNPARRFLRRFFG